LNAIECQGVYPLGHTNGVVPGSDAAGVIVRTGAKVTKWKIGDKVITMHNAYDLGGPMTFEKLAHGTGGKEDGVFAEYGVFNEFGVVRMPSNLTWEEASTLPIAGITAYNALFGLEGRRLKAGDFVLTQGTGGTSIFALQVS
jgi:NADPH:quinone reductase-like Zn-dependent oxidoreductase